MKYALISQRQMIEIESALETKRLFATVKDIETIDKALKILHLLKFSDAVEITGAELAKPEQAPTACGYDETVGMCTNNPCCEQEPVSHLWECIGRWSAYLAANGKQGNLAPPTWLVDAVKAATAPPRKPEQESVALNKNMTLECPAYLHELAKPEPKLTDAGADTNIDPFTLYPKGSGMVTLNQVGMRVDLKDTPPRKEWVGLTDDEVNLIYAEPQTNVGQYARAIEAKLRSKNERN
jgi:hypothetical protein